MRRYKSDEVEKNLKVNKKAMIINNIQRNNSLIKKHIFFNKDNII